MRDLGASVEEELDRNVAERARMAAIAEDGERLAASGPRAHRTFQLVDLCVASRAIGAERHVDGLDLADVERREVSHLELETVARHRFAAALEEDGPIVVEQLDEMARRAVPEPDDGLAERPGVVGMLEESPDVAVQKARRPRVAQLHVKVARFDPSRELIVVEAQVWGPGGCEFAVPDFRIHVFDLATGWGIDGLVGLSYLRQFNYQVRSAEGRILVERTTT